jgi:hypothetical protein
MAIWNKVSEQQSITMAQAYKNGATLSEASAIFGLSIKAARNALDLQGVELRQKGKLSEAERREIVRLYQNGIKTSILAAEFGVTNGGILALLVDNGVERRSLSASKRTYHCNHDFFECIDTEEKAYWLGFMAADGCVEIGKRKTMSLSLASQDESHVARFRDALSSNHPIGRGAKPKQCGRVGKDFYSRLRVCSSKLVDDLCNGGVCPRKSLVLEWPHSLPQELVRHYIRGYFDGDGTWTFKTQKNAGKNVQSAFSVISSKEHLLVLQNHLMQECGLGATTICETGKIFKLSYHGNRQVARIAHYLYHEAKIFLPRKLERIRPFLLAETSPVEALGGWA